MSSYFSLKQINSTLSNIDLSNAPSNSGFSISLFIEIAQQFSFTEQSTSEESSFQLLSSLEQKEEDNSPMSSKEIEMKNCTFLDEMRGKVENDQNSSLQDQDDCDDEDDEGDDHFSVKKSNVMKNILKSFQRYIETEKDQEVQKELCRLANKTYNYSQLKKLINRNLKAYGRRWNMKAKHMLEKSSFNMLLKYFLENINRIWLEKSKVQDKEEHLSVVNFMLQAIENPSNLSKLHFYQKKKSIQK